MTSFFDKYLFYCIIMVMVILAVKELINMFVFNIIPLLISFIPIVFIAWFLVKFLKAQQERNVLLKRISEKLDRLDG